MIRVLWAARLTWGREVLSLAQEVGVAVAAEAMELPPSALAVLATFASSPIARKGGNT